MTAIHRIRVLSCVVVVCTLVAGGCGRNSAPTPAAPTAEQSPRYRDATAPIAERVADLLARMTLDEKIGQMTQVERGFLKGEADIARYNLGSVFSGGGSAPPENAPKAWADMVDRYQQQALSTRLAIPLLYGIDAVHGHNTVKGAVVFPHNIGLGATRNPDLVREVGRITALEMLGTGIRWNFAPTLAVLRDERWGRSYESFGEQPDLVSTLGAAFVTGQQGKGLTDPTAVMVTAKHWIGDGGTWGGKDQGDLKANEAELRALHLPPYQATLKAGAGSVMASFSSWNGAKVHGHRQLLTTLLKEELGFTGFLVSDYKAIDQLSSDYAFAVRASINAGIDMVMVPEDYKRFISTLKAEVDAGRVPMERIDDAVRRILTRKFELGLFERPLADRVYTDQVGSPEHRALGREAVRQSLVLLKNEAKLLPLKKEGQKLFVAGKNADDIGNQCGGWTMTWQGKSGNITPGTTVLQAIRQTVAQGTTVTYNKAGEGIDGSYTAAIVVIGETPYAEYEGDRPGGLNLDQVDLDTLKRVKAAGIPTVVVLVSGRPLIVTEQLKDWNALVAAWLPGTEGQGVADVLFGDYKPTGKLPVSWPRSNDQIPVNVGDATYDPLFPFGFGLSY